MDNDEIKQNMIWIFEPIPEKYHKELDAQINQAIVLARAEGIAQGRKEVMQELKRDSEAVEQRIRADERAKFLGKSPARTVRDMLLKEQDIRKDERTKTIDEIVEMIKSLIENPYRESDTHKVKARTIGWKAFGREAINKLKEM
jgi:hypothetical protein